LIKLKNPIRHVVVTTTDDTQNVMGDVVPETQEPKTEVKQEEPEIKKEPVQMATSVQILADVKPTEEYSTPPETTTKDVIKKEKPEQLHAIFVGDTIADGTIFKVGQQFVQSWTMVNSGETTWPAGVSVKFVGGDYMHSKNTENSFVPTTTTREVKPGEEFTFSVNLNATWPAGKFYVSYWRLTTPDGMVFGDNLWCNIRVIPDPQVPGSYPAAPSAGTRSDETSSSASVVDAESVRDNSEFASVHEDMKRSVESHESQMIFPKLEVESPARSVEHLPERPAAPIKGEQKTPTSPVSSTAHTLAGEDGEMEDIDVSSLGDNDSFLTDEEYDVLDASDEEPFEECERIA